MIDIGTEFKATLVVNYMEEDDPPTYALSIKELEYVSLDSYLTEKELLEAFDPETKRKRLLAEKERIDSELKKLEEM